MRFQQLNIWHKYSLKHDKILTSSAQLKASILLQRPCRCMPKYFYRAMHFSAFARSCDRMSSVCPSVRLSVTLVICDHIDWKSWKLIAWQISPTPSLFAAKRRSTYSQGNMEKFWGDQRWGREKVACWRTKVAISLKRVKIEEMLLWTAYRKSPTLFRTVPSPTPYGLPFPKIRGSQPPPKIAI